MRASCAGLHLPAVFVASSLWTRVFTYVYLGERECTRQEYMAVCVCDVCFGTPVLVHTFCVPVSTHICAYVNV